MTKSYDEKFMSLAINLAKKNIGLTGKNPSVGCVITNNNEIIATGTTQEGGRPHAEIVAIDKIKDKKILKNCSIYITLEPCFKENNVDGCCNYIIKHQIPRVIIAMSDPNKSIDCKSIEKLKKHNIQVKVGILEDEARKINEFFIYGQLNQKPFITVKIATTLDGKIATNSGDSKWITGQKARFFGHYLRSINDAILIGNNCLKLDNPQLNCRIAGLENYSPKIIIMSNNFEINDNFNIISQQDKRPIFITTNQKKLLNDDMINEYRQKKITIIEYDDHRDFLQKIYCDHQIKSILVEGGSKVIGWMLKNDMIDRLIWIRSNKIIGNDAIPAIESLKINKISDAISNFCRQSTKMIDDDIVEIFDKFKQSD